MKHSLPANAHISFRGFLQTKTSNLSHFALLLCFERGLRALSSFTTQFHPTERTDTAQIASKFCKSTKKQVREFFVAETFWYPPLICHRLLRRDSCILLALLQSRFPVSKHTHKCVDTYLTRFIGSNRF